MSPIFYLLKKYSDNSKKEYNNLNILNKELYKYFINNKIYYKKNLDYNDFIIEIVRHIISQK
jgi:hypothetical protein